MKGAVTAASASHQSLSSYLLANGLVSRDLIGQALAEYYDLGYVDLSANPVSREVASKLPAEIATKWRVIPLEVKGRTAKIAVGEPLSKEAAEEVAKALKVSKLQVSFAVDDDIDRALLLYKQTLEARFVAIIKKQDKIAPEIVTEIITDAVSYRASDIHFEPQSGDLVLVRFRIDGLLREVGQLSKQHYVNILNRLKVQSRLRIDEHAAAQDGSMRFQLNGDEVDLRISVVPTVEGEKVAIRILAKYIKDFTLGELGLSDDNLVILQSQVTKPFGMVIVVGPTGSGKSTSLYAVLRYALRPEVNVTTIEDPVEYRISGVNQIQVNEDTGLTFAKGLRSIVRQDPDIILVGEIRDQETADIAVNAALTGHLLYSTFHANDAATSIPRLLEMGVEPFLIASTLELIIGQRLVRKICEQCRVSVPTSRADLTGPSAVAAKFLFGSSTKKIDLYHGKGCEACGGTGFQGRIGIFELIPMTTELRALVQKNPTSDDVWAVARKAGARSLFEDGLDKVKQGITTVDELLRVARPTNDQS